MDNHVCAVVVTYHPDRDLERRIVPLSKEVEGLVVVDNRSSDNERNKLRELAQRYSFMLLENAENLGIGEALNRGIRWAAGSGRFQYVLLLDQDSEFNGSLVESLLSSLRHCRSNKVAIVAPRIHNRNTGAMDGPKGARKDTYLVAQTSGSLMPLNVFEEVGWFKDELFIDYVDYEYCLRAVSLGWRIICCKDAVLSHSPGDSRRHMFRSIYLGTTMNYSPLRHYYITRNGAWVVGRYWKKYPGWCARQLFDLLKDKLKVILFERESGAKLRSSLRGLGDALQGSLGKNKMVHERRDNR